MSPDATNPYVGLRPFDVDESLLFFGRNDQTLELLQRLHKHHFVAVVGSSGCGKSSLLRAGLIPALKAGYLVDDSDNWFIAIMKPGQNPLYNLAESLLLQVNPQPDLTAVSGLVQKIEEEGADAILNVISQIRKENNTNFFLLVDQFEELFRFSMDQKDIDKKDEAIDFVNIILELSKQSVVPFYVVITMRSDFIGDCSQFFGLPEAMNKSQYLVPRLNRVQLKTVIEGPAKLYGGKLDSALTSLLLNELGKVKDELPLLQHALMRIWDYEEKINKSGALDLEDYSKIGGIEKALSNHADEALKEMSETELKITKTIFQALTSIDENGRKIRRPVLLSQLKELTGADEEQLLKIIKNFIDDKRSFLMINNVGDTIDKIIDISHESLIRQWNTLSKWVDEEGKSVANYIQLAVASKLYQLKRRDFLQGTELQISLDWKEKFQPSAIWANRYREGFDDAIEYLNKSKAIRDKEEAERIRKEFEETERKKKEQEREKQDKARKRKMLVLTVFVIVLLGLAGFSFWQTKNALKATQSLEMAQDSLDMANSHLENVLQLAVKGRTEKYSGLNTENLIAVLEQDRNLPIEKLIIPRAASTPVSDRNSTFLIWIDVPSFRRDEIKEVVYRLCPGFADRIRISREPSSGFAVGYLGWGLCPAIEITVRLQDETEIVKVFAMADYLEN
jgi:energy-coupling factor transporter ATP-binding protein EcfA2